MQSTQLNSVADVESGLKAYEVSKGIPVQTIEMKNNRIYHARTKLGSDYFRYLEGKDICRYHANWSGEFLKYGSNLAARRNDFRLFSTKRILVRQIPSKPPYCINACLIEEIALNDLNSINVFNIKIEPQLVLAILNSKLISYWFIHKFGKMQRGTFPQFKVNELATFPMPKKFGIYREILITKVHQIIISKRADQVAHFSNLTSEIDQIIYELYKLTVEEIALVENTTYFQ
ncbi:MAG: hypothetical protein H0X31_13545 [Nostocaceae cyanobacterium]|nr:hypothetical protein [Nostocaceae cyanobacterium]